MRIHWRSDDTAKKIDDEVARILREQEERARTTLLKHRRGLDLVAESLLEHETIDGATVARLIQEGLGAPTIKERTPEKPGETAPESRPD